MTDVRSAVVRSLILASALLFTGCKCSGLVAEASGSPRGGDGAVDEDAGRPPVRDAGGGVADASDGGPAEGPRSGHRIKVRGWAAGDVTTPSGVLWDDERGVECWLGLSADGRQRCLPTARGGAVWFTDASCLNPVVVLFETGDSCGPEPAALYAIDEVSLACPPTGRSVYALGTPLEPPAELYERSALGCLAVSPSGNNRFFEAVPSPSRDWVRFDRVLTKVTSRLGVGYWNGTDGSRVLQGLRLLPEDVPCGEHPGVTRCVPSNAVSQGTPYFDDDSCQRTVGLNLSCEPADVVWGLETEPPPEPAPCSPYIETRPLYRAEPVSSLTVHMIGPSGECTPTSLGGFKHYAPGEPIRLDEYPVLDTGHDGTGRFHEVYVTSEGQKLHTLDGQLYDTEVASTCAVWAPLADGRTFCIPDSALRSTDGEYADVGCTIPLPRVGLCSSGPAVAVAVYDPAAACLAAPSSLRRIVGVHTGSVFRGLFPPCSPVPPAERVELYGVGDPVDPGELFPLVTPQDL